jgi:hypothetical protein
VLNCRQVAREVSIHAQLDHPHIIAMVRKLMEQRAAPMCEVQTKILLEQRWSLATSFPGYIISSFNQLLRVSNCCILTCW